MIQVDLIDVVLDDGVDETLFTNRSTTSWTPTGIVPGNTYFFEVSFIDAYFLGDARTSTNGLPYLFTSGFQAYDRKYVPEPGVLRGITLGVLAIGVVGSRKRLRV